jgi:hypothetical protein
MRRIVAVILSAVAASTTCAAREPLELKGDRIGETIAQFTAYHPNAKCEDRTPNIRECSQRTGVSLAGLPTLGSTCDPPASPYWHDVCGLVGLFANFHEDKLSDLSYRFYINGAVNDVQINTSVTCDAFTKKYGKPDLGDGHHACNWFIKNKDEEIEQSLLVSTENSKIGGKDAVFTVVVLAHTAPSKDI